jgi:hypothetical protein
MLKYEDWTFTSLHPEGKGLKAVKGRLTLQLKPKKILALLLD